jgi:hypothetical protein
METALYRKKVRKSAQSVRIFTHLCAPSGREDASRGGQRKTRLRRYGSRRAPRFFTHEEDKIFRKPLFFE